MVTFDRQFAVSVVKKASAKWSYFRLEVRSVPHLLYCDFPKACNAKPQVVLQGVQNLNGLWRKLVVLPGRPNKQMRINQVVQDLGSTGNRFPP